MIVDCPSCGATYNISDEKVRGRRVRVRCKNCSGPIIVDGDQIDADDATRVYQPQLEPNTYEETRVYKPSLEPNTYEDTDESTRVMTVGGAQSEAAPGAWTVNVSDADQRTMTLEEIVDTYNAGFISDDAFVWRDGMSDWVALMQVEEIRSAIESNQATHVVKPAVMQAHARRSAVNPPTPISYAGPAAAPPRARQAPAPTRSVEYVAPARALPSSPEPARLRDGRNASADLFGAIATAGSEQELLSSSSMPLAAQERPTGARNESSVLFSLNTVRAGVGPTSAPPRGLGAAPPTAAQILGMDMAGGLPGVDLNAALATAPVVEPPPQPQRRITPPPPPRERMDTLPPTMRRRGNPLMIAAVVVAAGVMVAGLVFVLRTRTNARAASPAAMDTSPPATRTGEPVAATGHAEVSPGPDPTTSAVAAAAAPASAIPSEPTPAVPPVNAPPAAPVAPAAPQPQLRQLPAPVAAPKPLPGRPAPAPQDKAAKPEAAAKGDQKIVLEEESSEAAPKEKAGAPSEPAPAPAEPDKPPFDMSAAKAALESAAGSAAACKADDGPTGRGKVQVTFAPTGRVTSANVVEGAFGGTSVGGCVAKLFRNAKVPAFSGDPVTVAKAFTIPE